MDNRILAVLVPSVEKFTSLAEKRLPGFLSAFYIVGSIALDEFNPYFSDVDFIAMINHCAAENEIETLREIHQKMEGSYPHWKLSGTYLLSSDLGKQSRDIGERVVFHDGKLQPQANFDVNPVTWWILKNRGISVLGCDPCELPIVVDENYLVTWTLENMNTYWKSWTRQPGKLIAMLSDWGIQWTVLGVARQFYTIREKLVITKVRSGKYTLAIVPERWHRIIKEAICVREKSAGKFYRLRFVRVLDAVRFMKFIIQSSNEHLAKES